MSEQRLSAEEEAAIRTRLAKGQRRRVDIEALLAELDRLRAELQAEKVVSQEHWDYYQQAEARLRAAEARVGELESDGSRLICWNHDGIVSLGYVKETEAGPMYTCPQCSASVVRQESPDGE